MGGLKDFNSLNSSSEFSLIFKEANRWHTEYAVIFYKVADEKKIGFVASKKVGNSVKRNLAKRRLRAIFVELCDALSSGVYVFVAKDNINNVSYKELKSSILWSFKKLDCLKN